MAMKVKRMLVALAAALCVISVANPMIAYAEESVLEEAFVSDTEVTVAEDTTTEEAVTEETVTEETATEETEETTVEETEAEAEATGTDSSFSVSGNGELLDDITDDSTKEFFTITTANGNTYFLVIDRSSSTENVYMLSMIDEYDLQDFLEEAEESDTTGSSTGTVVLEEQTTSAETSGEQNEGEEPAVTEDEESSSGAAVLLVLVLAAAGCGGAYFYFKVYKPKHDADAYESEGMEIGDGLETINEDEAGDGESDDEE